MSMNIEIYGEREVKVLKTGSVEKQRIYLDVWQTPTRISYEIQDATHPIEEYFKWVDNMGTESGTTHIKHLKSLIEVYEKLGYEFSVEVV